MAIKRLNVKIERNKLTTPWPKTSQQQQSQCRFTSLCAELLVEHESSWLLTESEQSPSPELTEIRNQNVTITTTQTNSTSMCSMYILTIITRHSLRVFDIGLSVACMRCMIIVIHVKFGIVHRCTCVFRQIRQWSRRERMNDTCFHVKNIQV